MIQKMLSFYIIFRSRLLVVTMTEMYSKNHAVSYKLHIIKQTVNIIDCNMLRLNFSIKQNLVVLYVNSEKKSHFFLQLCLTIQTFLTISVYISQFSMSELWDKKLQLPFLQFFFILWQK